MFTGKPPLDQSDCSMMKWVPLNKIAAHIDALPPPLPIALAMDKFGQNSIFQYFVGRKKISHWNFAQKITDNRAHIMNKLLHGSLACMDYIHESKYSANERALPSEWV